MKNLEQIAKETFHAVLKAADARAAVRNAVEFGRTDLRIGERRFDLEHFQGIYAIAVGKAAGSMALGFSDRLGENLSGVLISAPESEVIFPAEWRVFHGGHPLPNDESFRAAAAARDLLEKIDCEKTLVIFLISGGGSAMFEMPADGISPEDLTTTNQLLVNCGAAIGEVNAVRLLLSMVKGGGLAGFAPKSKKITLLISDTNADEPHNVASGLTFQTGFGDYQIGELIDKYRLRDKLPSAVLHCLNKPQKDSQTRTSEAEFSVLLDNRDAVDSVRRVLTEQGFVVEIAEDLVEAEIEFGCAELVKRFERLRLSTDRGKQVALVSGGEFTCTVRGNGTGGRSLESALRTSILFDDLKKHSEFAETRLTALFAGTDGIDGNSPAAGAICSDSTICRAKVKDLSAQEYLERSDSFGFFAELDDLIITGSTETNVRDIRILLAD